MKKCFTNKAKSLKEPEIKASTPIAKKAKDDTTDLDSGLSDLDDFSVDDLADLDLDDDIDY